MAQTLVCDGCGAVHVKSDDGWGDAGLVEKKDYCLTCLQKAEEYMRRRDEIHDALAVQRKDQMGDLDKEFGESLHVLPI